MSTEVGGRRKAPLGLSIGTWISLSALAITILVGAIAYGGQQNQVINNSMDIKDNKEAVKEIKEEMRESAKELRKEIKDSAQQTQKVMREQIKLIIKVVESRNGPKS